LIGKGIKNGRSELYQLRQKKNLQRIETFGNGRRRKEELGLELKSVLYKNSCRAGLWVQQDITIQNVGTSRLTMDFLMRNEDDTSGLDNQPQQLFSTLFVGESETAGLYAIPAYVDEKTITIAPRYTIGPPLLEGKMPIKYKSVRNKCSLTISLLNWMFRLSRWDQ